MKMPVRIDMVERQPGRPKGLELGGNFRADLPARGRIDCAAGTVANEIVTQTPGRLDERGNLRAWSNRIAVDKDDVKPNPQAR